MKDLNPTCDISTKIWLSEVELCQYLTLSRKSIFRARTERGLPYKKPMGKILYKRTEVDEWIEKQHREGLKATNLVRK